MIYNVYLNDVVGEDAGLFDLYISTPKEYFINVIAVTWAGYHFADGLSVDDNVGTE